MQVFSNTFLLEPRLYEVATIARAGDGVYSSFRKFTANFIFLFSDNRQTYCFLYRQDWQGSYSLPLQLHVLRLVVFFNRTRVLSYTASRPVWGRETLLSRGFRMRSQLFNLHVFM